jgi:uncharacterized protein (TIGR03790 family)
MLLPERRADFARWKPVKRFLLWKTILALAAASAVHALEPAQLVIVSNRDVPLSSEVAKMYRQARQIPQENILSLHLGESRSISREQYATRLAQPLKKYLEEHPAIRCVLTTAGVPYVIQGSPGGQDGAAVDNELAAVLREPKDWNLWQANPLYYRGLNHAAVEDPRALQMVYVARLDGPDLRTLTRMVDDAMATEKVGLAGPVFGDAQGLDGNTGYAAADASIRAAIDRLAGAGFPAVLDMNQADWRPTAGEVGEQAAGAAFYVGWYSLQTFRDIFGSQGLARGAIAWHVASGEAVDIWNANSTGWCVNLMRRGAAVTLGPVFEPYVGAFPRGEILVESLLAGRTIAESYWLALPHVSWAMVLLGDPLYRPFAVKPKPALVARAYVGGGSAPVIEKGQTGSLLVQVQCVGPAGSSTPPFTAAVEAETGLAAASGMVTIPALQAGQIVVVRVPSITMSTDASAMFRLRLNVRNPGETRRVVLEGRTGFSKVIGLGGRQTQMFVSANGGLVISGNGASAVLTETSTLQARRVGVPAGWVVAGAAFSPDQSHVALALVQPQEKRVGFMLADSKLQQSQSLPEGSQFIRWLSDDTMLLKTNNGLTQFQIGTRTALPVFQPAGWTVNTIGPGSALQLLIDPTGRFAVKNGPEPLQEVLAGTNVTRDRAVANDLSMFGGLDEQKRLWIQHGLGTKPEVAAEQVEKIAWGPVSRRVLIQEANGNLRVYDGRTRSWSPLPPMLMAQWSSDEERLLFLEAERQEKNLVPRWISLWDGRQTERLADMGRIGDVGAMAFAGEGNTAFLLSGGNDALDVWMMALPPSSRKR